MQNPFKNSVKTDVILKSFLKDFFYGSLTQNALSNQSVNELDKIKTHYENYFLNFVGYINKVLTLNCLGQLPRHVSK